MATIIINYSDLAKIESYATKAANAAGDYASRLSTKSSSKLDSLTGGATGYTSSAKYYVDAKINALNEKKTSFTNFSKQVHTFSETAKRVDGDVKTLLASGQKDFYKTHEDLKIDDWKANLINWFTDLKNSCPLFELIGNLVYTAGEKVRDALASIKYWYECEGGKEKVAFAAAIFGFVAAVLLFIATFPLSSFFAVCAMIGAAIGAINALTNIFTSYAAMKAAKDGDPAWAKIYGDRDKLSDVLRETNFHDKTWNRITNIGAAALDITEFCVGVINLVHGLSQIKSQFTALQNFFDKNNGGLFTYFKEAKWQEVLEWNADGTKVIGTKWQMVTNEKGIVETKFTLRSIWRGTKAFVLNSPIDCHSEQGIRTLLCKNFILDFKTVMKTKFSPGSTYDSARYHFKSVEGMFEKGLKWKDRAGYIKDVGNTLNAWNSSGSKMVKMLAGEYTTKDYFDTLKKRSFYNKVIKTINQGQSFYGHYNTYSAAFGA